MDAHSCADRTRGAGPAQYSDRLLGPRRLLAAAILVLAWCAAATPAPTRGTPGDDAARLKEARRQEEEGRLDRVRRETRPPSTGMRGGSGKKVASIESAGKSRS